MPLTTNYIRKLLLVKAIEGGSRPANLKHNTQSEGVSLNEEKRVAEKKLNATNLILFNLTFTAGKGINRSKCRHINNPINRRRIRQNMRRHLRAH